MPRAKDSVADAIEFFVGGFLQTLHGCLTVDGVDHYLLGSNGFHGFEPWGDVFFAGVIIGAPSVPPVGEGCLLGTWSG